MRRKRPNHEDRRPCRYCGKAILTGNIAAAAHAKNCPGLANERRANIRRFEIALRIARGSR